MGKFFDVQMESLYEDRVIDYPYTLDCAEEIKKIKLFSDTKEPKVLHTNRDELKYYHNFGKKDYTSGSHYSSSEPSPEELMKAYGWSFT